MSDAPRYEIRTAADFLTVPKERRAECLREFGLWLDMHDDFAVLLGNQPGHPLVVKWGGVFLWIDDDKRNFKITLKCVDSLDAEGRK